MSNSDGKDWTKDSESGRSNSSPEYCLLVEQVARLIQNDAHALLSGNVAGTARLVVSNLAHRFGLVPTKRVGEMRRIVAELRAR